MRFFILISLTILFIGCGGNSETVNTNTTTNTAIKNTANAPASANNPLGTTNMSSESASKNDAATVAPVMTAYYEALKKKDDAALRKTLSQATLKSYEKDMKEEGETSLSRFITDLEPVSDKPFEVRNETVIGNEIVAEVRGGSYPNGIKVKFVKENGEWRKTNESPDVKMSGTAPGSNSAK